MALSAGEIQMVLSARDNASRVIAQVEAQARSLDSTLKQVVVTAAGMAGGIQIWQAYQMAVQTAREAVVGFNASLQMSQMAWTTMLDSAENAKAMMFELQQFAIKTPFDFSNAEHAARMLMGMGFQAKEVLPTLYKVAKYSASMGMSSAGLFRISYALSQMNAVGRVLGQDLLQLNQAGVSTSQIFGVMAEQTGKTVGELKAMQMQGQLTADTFMKAFNEWIERRFGSALENAAGTFQQSMNTIKESMLLLFSLMSKPVFERQITAIANNMAKALQSPALMDFAQNVRAAVDSVLDGLQALKDGFSYFFGGIWEIVSSVGRSVYEALSWLNPFARHSPSLVEQVDKGVDRIIESYKRLGKVKIAPPKKDGGNQHTGPISGVSPYEKHSPSLVEQVTRGMEEILKEYGRLDEIEAPIRRAMGYLSELGSATIALGEKVKSLNMGEQMKLLAKHGGQGMVDTYLAASAAADELEESMEPLRKELVAASDAIADEKKAVEDAARAVSSQERAVRTLQRAYQPLNLQIRGASYALADKQHALELTNQKMDVFRQGLADAQAEMQSWASTPLAGQGEFEDRLFGINQQARIMKAELAGLEMSGEPSERIEVLRKGIARLGQEAEKVQADRDVLAAPLEHAKRRASELKKEKPFDEILRGLATARSDAERYQAAIEPLAQVWEDQTAEYQNAFGALQTLTNQRWEEERALRGQNDALADAQYELSRLQDVYATAAEPVEEMARKYGAMESSLQGYKKILSEMAGAASDLESAQKKDKSGLFPDAKDQLEGLAEAMEDAKKKLAEFEAKFTNAKIKIRVALAPIAQAITDAFQPFATASTFLRIAAQELDEFKDAGDIEGWSSRWSAILTKTFAMVASRVAELPKMAGDAFRAGLNALGSGLRGDIQGGAGALIGAIKTSMRSAVGSADWSPVWSEAGRIFTGLLMLIPNTAMELFNVFKGELARVDWAGVWDGAGAMLAALGAFLANSASKIADGLKNAMGSVKWNEVWAGALGLVDAFIALFVDVGVRIQKILTEEFAKINWAQVMGTPQGFQEAIDKMIRGAKPGSTDAGATPGGQERPGPSSFQKGLTDLFNEVKAFFVSAAPAGPTTPFLTMVGSQAHGPTPDSGLVERVAEGLGAMGDLPFQGEDLNRLAVALARHIEATNRVADVDERLGEIYEEWFPQAVANKAVQVVLRPKEGEAPAKPGIGVAQPVEEALRWGGSLAILATLPGVLTRLFGGGRGDIGGGGKGLGSLVKPLALAGVAYGAYSELSGVAQGKSTFGQGILAGAKNLGQRPGEVAEDISANLDTYAAAAGLGALTAGLPGAALGAMLAYATTPTTGGGQEMVGEFTNEEGEVSTGKLKTPGVKKLGRTKAGAVMGGALAALPGALEAFFAAMTGQTPTEGGPLDDILPDLFRVPQALGKGVHEGLVTQEEAAAVARSQAQTPLRAMPDRQGGFEVPKPAPPMPHFPPTQQVTAMGEMVASSRILGPQTALPDRVPAFQAVGPEPMSELQRQARLAAGLVPEGELPRMTRDLPTVGPDLPTVGPDLPRIGPDLSKAVQGVKKAVEVLPLPPDSDIPVLPEAFMTSGGPGGLLGGAPVLPNMNENVLMTEQAASEPVYGPQMPPPPKGTLPAMEAVAKELTVNFGAIKAHIEQGQIMEALGDIAGSIGKGLESANWNQVANDLGKLVGNVLKVGLTLMLTVLNLPALLVAALVEGPGAGGVAGAIASFFLGIFEEVIPFIGDHWQEILLGLVSVLLMPVSWIKAFGGAARAIPWPKVIAPLGEGLGMAFNGIADLVGNINLTGKLAGLMGRLFGPVGELFDTMLGQWGKGSWVGRLWGAISEAFNLEKLGQMFTPKGGGAEVPNSILEWLVNGFRELGGKGVKALGDAIGGWFKGIFDDLGKIVDLKEQGAILGQNLVFGVTSGLTLAWFTLTSSISEFVGNLVKEFKRLLGISSPSTVMAEIGENLIAGLIAGIEAYVGIPGRILGFLKDNVLDRIGEWLDGTELGKVKNRFIKMGEDFIGRIGDGLKNAPNALAGLGETVWGWLKSAFDFSGRREFGPFVWENGQLRLKAVGEPKAESTPEPVPNPVLNEQDPRNWPRGSASPGDEDEAFRRFVADRAARRASGGMATKQELTWIGERGPEAIVPLSGTGPDGFPSAAARLARIMGVSVPGHANGGVVGEAPTGTREWWEDQTRYMNESAPVRSSTMLPDRWADMQDMGIAPGELGSAHEAFLADLARRLATGQVKVTDLASAEELGAQLRAVIDNVNSVNPQTLFGKGRPLDQEELAAKANAIRGETTRKVIAKLHEYMGQDWGDQSLREAWNRQTRPLPGDFAVEGLSREQVLEVYRENAEAWDAAYDLVPPAWRRAVLEHGVSFIPLMKEHAAEPGPYNAFALPQPRLGRDTARVGLLGFWGREPGSKALVHELGHVMAYLNPQVNALQGEIWDRASASGEPFPIEYMVTNRGIPGMETREISSVLTELSLAPSGIRGPLTEKKAFNERQDLTDAWLGVLAGQPDSYRPPGIQDSGKNLLQMILRLGGSLRSPLEEYLPWLPGLSPEGLTGTMPEFATGGMATGPMLAKLGEAGAEYVVPAAQMARLLEAQMARALERAGLSASGSRMLAAAVGPGRTVAPQLNINTPLVGSITVQGEADEDRLVAKMGDMLLRTWRQAVSQDVPKNYGLGGA